MSSEWFSGKTAVVTGAGHGIGLGIATALHKAGVRVCGVEIDEKRAESLSSNDIIAIHGDISDGTSVADQVIDRLDGPPELIVNNVGVMDGRSFLELPMDAVEKSWRANVLGPWAFSQRLAQSLIDNQLPGTFLFVLSLHSQRIRMCPDHSTSKATLRMLMEEMAYALGPYGIRVNGISPGAIDTWSDTSPDSPEHLARTNAMIPLGRLGQVDDVIDLALFLLNSSVSQYITGSDMVVDGGLLHFNWLHHNYGSAGEERRRFTEGINYSRENA